MFTFLCIALNIYIASLQSIRLVISVAERLQTAVPKAPGSIPGSENDVYASVFVLVLRFHVLEQEPLFVMICSHYVCNAFLFRIYLTAKFVTNYNGINIKT